MEDTNESFHVNFQVYDFSIQKLTHMFYFYFGQPIIVSTLSKSIAYIFLFAQLVFFITFAEEMGFSTDKGFNPWCE
jgi:hypothetical protein